MDIYELEDTIKAMIDDLQGICRKYGHSGDTEEQTIITNVFLYKFLNDKFDYNLRTFAAKLNTTPQDVLTNEEQLNVFYDNNAKEVAFEERDTIASLLKHLNDDDFYSQFDSALERISSYPRNLRFSIKNVSGDSANGGALFTKISPLIDDNEKNIFVQRIFRCIAQEKFDFSEAFSSNFDFYSTIFEYLIKNYNKDDGGELAEYFTPQSVSSIIAKILVEMSPIEDVPYEVYDPSAGSGSLVLHLANALGKGSFGGDKAQVYTQDISPKSTGFLRINLLLNGLTGSLDRVVRGDTLTDPSHFVEEGNPSSGIKKFHFITSNPPFKTKYSEEYDKLEATWNKKDFERDGITRFFAGVPKEPKKDKKQWPIYLCFIQHILWSLESGGKAAIVVPTGFLTATGSIEKKIRETIINNHWLKGVISMPSNIFATTGTKVSVLFIDKANTDGNIILIDAADCGDTNYRDSNNKKKTILRQNEIEQIENAFISQQVVKDFSVLVTYDQIKEKNYSFAAGQYFDIELEYVQLTQDEFTSKINKSKSDIKKYFDEGKKTEEKIEEELENLIYE